MKNTALTQWHIENGAKMVEYAGYNMPISFEGITPEHLCVRKSVGIFDVSHMGQFMVEGPQAQQLVDSICSNNVSKLVDDQAQYNCLPNNAGGIVDDLIAYRFNSDRYMLVVNASNIDKDWKWITDLNSFDAQLTDVSSSMSLIAVQGPKAVDLVAQAYPSCRDIGFYHFKEDEFLGIPNVIISATGYTGSGGFELYVPNGAALFVWEWLLENGQDMGIKPIGLGARDTLRLEMGYCLYGNDINDVTSPIEAGLGWITKTKKKANFPSKELFLKQRAQGVKQKLVGFKLEGKRVPRQGYPIVDKNGHEVGTVTSGTMSPSLEHPIAMGYIKVDALDDKTGLAVAIRSKIFPIEIVNLPFYKTHDND